MTSVPAAATEDTGPLALGAVVAERYRVLALLGMGGMGAVYRVEHVHMRKELALKVLHADAARMPEIVARFEREAVAASSITHPNVAAATDFGKLEDGAFFLVLELVDGRSLRDELAAGALAPERATRILRAIVGAVAAAHEQGIVHRDLKPENVMLVKREGDDDFVKVLDFGIAKVTAPDPTSPTAGGNVLTRLGAIMGTPGYMSPEQALGQTVDVRSDLYSLGVIFHEMLVGECPFTGSAVSVLRKHMLEPPPPLPPPVVSRGGDAIEPILHKLLAKEPGARFQTASELAAALDDATRMRGSNPALVVAPAPAQTATSPAATKEPGGRRMLAVAALVAVAVAGIVVVSASGTSGPPLVATSHPAEPLSSAIANASSQAARAAAPEPSVDVASDRPAAAPATSAARPAARPQPKKRKTGPGGIYIPPIGDLFK